MKLTRVASTNLAAVGYDLETRVLTVEFLPKRNELRGPIYQYRDVPPPLAGALLTTANPGRTLLEPKIKPVYDFRLLGESRWKSPSQAQQPGRRSARPTAPRFRDPFGRR